MIELCMNGNILTNNQILKVTTMKTIYKYSISITESQIVNMPIGSNIISLQMQNGIATMWAIVDTTESLTPVKIRIFGTGEEIPAGSVLRHIGSIQEKGYVWHIFIDDTICLNPIVS